MKVNRHAKIVELINKYQIETQDELAEYLNEAGFKVTQATVSRDIRDLKLTKVPAENGRQKYAVLQSAQNGMTEKICAHFAGWIQLYGYGSEHSGTENGIRYGDGGGCGTGCDELE